MYTPDQFAGMIKEKYPAYSNVPNLELSQKIIAKYPQYAAQVDMNTAPVAKTPELSQTEKQVAEIKKTPDWIKPSGKGVLTDVGEGVLKGGADTLNTLSSGLNTVNNFLSPTARLAGGNEAPKLPMDTTPANTGEKIGYGAEKVGEYFLPGAAGLKAEKGAGLLTKAAIGAASAGGVSAVQEKGINKNVGIMAATGGAAEGLSPLIEKGAKTLGEYLYSKVIPTTILERGKDAAKGINIGKAVSETGISATKGQVLNKIGNLTDVYGQQLQGVIDSAMAKNPNKTWTIKEITGVVKNDILNDPNVMKSIKATPIDVPKVEAIVNDVLGDYNKLYKGKKLNLQDVQDLKVALGQGLQSEYDRAIGATLKAKPMTEMKLRSTLKTAIEENAPGAKAVNEKLAPLFTAEKRLIRKGDYSGYLTDFLAGGLYAGRPQEILSDPVGYLKSFAEGVIMKRLGTGTLSKTVGGSIMTELGKVLESPGVANAITGLVHEVIAPSTGTEAKSSLQSVSKEVPYDTTIPKVNEMSSTKEFQPIHEQAKSSPTFETFIEKMKKTPLTPEALQSFKEKYNPKTETDLLNALKDFYNG